MINTHYLELPQSQKYFHGSKRVRAIEVSLSYQIVVWAYMHISATCLVSRLQHTCNIFAPHVMFFQSFSNFRTCLIRYIRFFIKRLLINHLSFRLFGRLILMCPEGLALFFLCGMPNVWIATESNIFDWFSEQNYQLTFTML